MKLLLNCGAMSNQHFLMKLVIKLKYNKRNYNKSIKDLLCSNRVYRISINNRGKDKIDTMCICFVFFIQNDYMWAVEKIFSM